LPFPYTVVVAVAAAVAYLFAVYGCNGTEFSYVIFTEQRNFTTAERRNGNVRTATEWWKPGIILYAKKHSKTALVAIVCDSLRRSTSLMYNNEN